MTKRHDKHQKWIGVASLLLLLFLLSVRRANTYRKVIYHYEGMTTATPATQSEYRSDIERYVGRPNFDVYRLPKRPRYKHFWDDYNTKTPHYHDYSE